MNKIQKILDECNLRFIDKEGNDINVNIDDILYIGLFLRTEHKLDILFKLSSYIKKINNDRIGNITAFYCHHITLLHPIQLGCNSIINDFKDIINTLAKNDNLGSNVTAIVEFTGIDFSNKVIALKCNIKTSGIIATIATAHLTVATLGNGKPIDSNYLTNFSPLEQNYPINQCLVYLGAYTKNGVIRIDRKLDYYCNKLLKHIK